MREDLVDALLELLLELRSDAVGAKIMSAGKTKDTWSGYVQFIFRLK